MRKLATALTVLLMAATDTFGCDGKDGAETGADGGESRDASSDDVTSLADAADAGTDRGAERDAPSDVLQIDASDASACVPQPPVPPALEIVNVSTATFGASTFAAQPPSSDDWYIVEQSGLIRIIRGGTVLPTPFLDLSSAMGSGFGERGLLSIAFHPSYGTNGRFFVMGTPATGADGTFAATNADAVVEFQRNPANADVALPTKVRDVVVLPASDEYHNGGTIMFGADNYLYVGTGDGGGDCESVEPGAVQDTAKLFGKILRLDVDAAPPFAAPGNPFTNDARVFHYGLRNPFRWSFDSVTHDLYIGNVGLSSYESIFVAAGNAPGQNFGWPAYEGAVQGTCGDKPLGGPSPRTAPIVSIDRTAASTSPFKDYKAIIGGRVYRGAAMPSLQGVYLFADYGGKEFGALRVCNGQTYGPVAIPIAQIPTVGGGALPYVTAFATGNDGELYIVYAYGSTRLGRLAPQ